MRQLNVTKVIKANKFQVTRFQALAPLGLAYMTIKCHMKLIEAKEASAPLGHVWSLLSENKDKKV